MKLLFTGLLILLTIGIVNAQENKAELIKDLTDGVISLEISDLNESSPISSINKLAFEQAAKSIVVTKENMGSSLEEAKAYKSCVITVGVHTIVVVENFSKTVRSGSWGANMPWGKGFIQKGSMNFKEDYINNIIGMPDGQRRMMFLFK
ncbi:hypothetical protein [Plebeiibacterium sediminum]|uniref:Uncharacterized protein n=1 Tax=Plebeiibacterium sediminum TaxID=2992112 RepID=A0AAE3M115_9BACT|nr:hypothetical protein [Plebeiobacterium sediminum]MCW3785306.1 hypothetical protein [Plebeiobacterium sediminum]